MERGVGERSVIGELPDIGDRGRRPIDVHGHLVHAEVGLDTPARRAMSATPVDGPDSTTARAAAPNMECNAPRGYTI